MRAFLGIVAPSQVEALNEANGIHRSEGFGKGIDPKSSYLLCASNIRLGRRLTATSQDSLFRYRFDLVIRYFLLVNPNLPNQVGALTNQSQFSRFYFEKQL